MTRKDEIQNQKAQSKLAVEKVAIMDTESCLR